MLTQARLKEVLKYNQRTGLFIWKVNACSVVRQGSIAGSFDEGYVRIHVDCAGYYAHRLAFLYVKGYMPKMVDHRDGDPSNNAFKNLRAADYFINTQNVRKPRKHNKSTGVLGVSKGWKSYSVRMYANGVRYYFGPFTTAEEASEAYVKAKRKLHKGCAI